MGFPGGTVFKKYPPANAGDTGHSVRSPGQEDPLEEEMTTHSSILAWRIPMDRRAWRTTVHGVTKSQTRRKQLAHVPIGNVSLCKESFTLLVLVFFFSEFYIKSLHFLIWPW